jgi:signal transduction histidine kinase/CheY-like chemotaxis protein
MCQSASPDLSNLQHGSHTCFVYDTMEDYQYVATNYAKDGLLADELVICVLDEYPRDTFIEDLKNLDLDVDKFIESGSLIISSLRSAYRGGSEFVPDNSINYWKDLVSSNLDRKGIRAMGEATFALDGTFETLQRLIEYEIKVNLNLMPIFNKHQYLCVYNKSLYPSSVLKSIIQSHPSALNNKMMYKKNPYYIESNENIASHSSEIDLYKTFGILDHSVNINLEKNLRPDEETFKYILEGIGDVIWNYDILNDKVSFNEHWFQKLNIDSDLFKNNLDSLKALIHPDDCENFSKSLDKLISEQIQLLKLEFRMKSSHDSYIWFECIARGIGKTEHGQTTRVVGTFRDINQRKTLEESIIQAKEEAISASEAKSAFLANMSHEIRTPLNGIMGMLQLLESTELEQKQQQFINRAFQSTEHLVKIIDDILDYSKIELGKIALESIEFNLKILLDDLVGVFLISAANKNISIKTNISDDIPNYFVGDPFRLRQVLSNLLGNAIKFTEAGFVKITANKKSMPSNSTVELEFAIEDSGVGISDKQKEMIFQSFTQGDSSLTKKFGGTGLGLVIADNLARLMNGNIRFESEEKKGSTFFFTCCLDVNTNYISRDSVTSDYTENPNVSTSAADAKTPHILIVEDDEMNQYVLENYIAENGWKCTKAANGKEAIELFEKNTFDLVLMDVQMPEIDGYTATKIIRKMEKEKYRHTPIIAVTAFAMKHDEEKCLDAGMDDYISKPILFETFVSKINKWI